MRKILITLDYELFFGQSGSIEKSIIEPTEKLLSILDRFNIKASFFVDSGYILKLKEYMRKFDVLNSAIYSEMYSLQNTSHPHCNYETGFTLCSIISLVTISEIYMKIPTLIKMNIKI